METLSAYGVQSKIRPGCLTVANEWQPPSGEEIKAALSMAGWTAVEFSRRIYANDRTIRRWVGNEKPIPYAAWCVLCVEANLGQIWR